MLIHAGADPREAEGVCAMPSHKLPKELRILKVQMRHYNYTMSQKSKPLDV